MHTNGLPMNYSSLLFDVLTFYNKDKNYQNQILFSNFAFQYFSTVFHLLYKTNSNHVSMSPIPNNQHLL